MDKRYSKNLFWLMASSLFSVPLFWLVNISDYAITVKGIDESLFFTFFGAYSILILLMEVPTGVVADRVSRKLSLLLGYATAATAFLLFVILPGILSSIALFVILAIGVSLISGAYESLLYDTLDEVGKAKEYKRYNSVRSMIAILLGALYTFLGGVISEHISLSAPFLLTAVFYVFSMLTFTFVKEPNLSKEARDKNQLNYLEHTIATFKKLLGKGEEHSNLLSLAILFAIYNSMVVGLKYVIPPIYQGFGLGKVTVGAVSSSSLIAIALSSVLFITLWKGKDKFKVIVASVAMVVGTSLIVISGISLFLAIFVLSISIGGPIITTIFDQVMNEQISSNMRSSVISLRNMISRGIGAFLLSIFGVAKDFFSIRIALVFLVIWLSIPVIIMLSLQIKGKLLEKE